MNENSIHAMFARVPEALYRQFEALATKHNRNVKQHIIHVMQEAVKKDTKHAK